MARYTPIEYINEASRVPSIRKPADTGKSTTALIVSTGNSYMCPVREYSSDRSSGWHRTPEYARSSPLGTSPSLPSTCPSHPVDRTEGYPLGSSRAVHGTRRRPGGRGSHLRPPEQHGGTHSGWHGLGLGSSTTGGREGWKAG